MIKAVIFDCYGVLTSDGWLPYVKKYFSSDESKKAHAHSLMHERNVGLLSEGQFYNAVAELSGMPALEVERAIDSTTPNEELLSFVATLKRRLKIGMLSNAGGNWLRELFTPQQLSLFDAVALSFETGYAKPLPQAYKQISDLLNVEPKECLFIDDIGRYVDAASATGMSGIVFVNNEQVIADIQQKLADADV